MLTEIGLLLVGIILLFAGGEALVRGAVSLANRLGLPPLVIGLTVVGFGTSTPELMVSLQAALAGLPDIAVGNVVGSNTANILLILGVSALIAPIAVRIAGISRDITVMVAVAVVMLALGLIADIGRMTGAAMVFVLVVYIAYATMTARREIDPDPELLVRLPLWQEVLAVIGGLAALMGGAHFLVDGATAIARSLGVSEAVIGLTVVAVGTSLPELATSVVAAFRRHSEVAIGNVVGSNIFNILGILGVTAAVHPVSIAPEMTRFDIPVMLAVSVVAAIVILKIGRIGRLVGGLFLAGYAAYVFVLF